MYLHVRCHCRGVTHPLAADLAVKFATIFVLHISVGFKLTKEIKVLATNLAGHIVFFT